MLVMEVQVCLTTVRPVFTYSQYYKQAQLRVSLLLHPSLSLSLSLSLLRLILFTTNSDIQTTKSVRLNHI